MPIVCVYCRQRRESYLVTSRSYIKLGVFCMCQPEYKIADPICTFVFSFLVLCTTLTVLRDILLIIMEGELVNPLKCTGIRQLHLKVFSAIPV